MSDQGIHSSKYSKLRSIYKNYIDSYIALYQLKAKTEEELNSIYQVIKSELIDSIKYSPDDIVRDILDIIPYNNRYTESYLELAKRICEEYHVTSVSDVEFISIYLFYKEYGIVLDSSNDFEEIKSEDLNIHSENTIYRAIMYDDIENFIPFIELDGFDENQEFDSSLYPPGYGGFSLLELCCYHGAVGCFKLLRTKFSSEITDNCLRFSFLGGNPEIMSECLKVITPDWSSMEYAIISHNIDFVSFLMNEYNIEIGLNDSLI